MLRPSMRSAQEASADDRRPVAGASLMLGGCAVLTLNDAIMKDLVETLPLGQMVCLRGLAGAAAAVLIAPLLGGAAGLRPKSLSRAFTLSALLLVGLFLFPLSLRHLPLADAIMLVSVSPLFVAALSPVMLGEQVGWRRWGAVLIGLLGTMLVLAPGSGGLNPVMLLPILVAFLVALRDILTRRYIAGESALALIFLANLSSGVVGLLSVPTGWIALSTFQTVLLLSTAVLLTVSQVMLVAAFRHADATVLSCLKYSGIVWGALFGWLVWGDTLGLADWAGAALITASGVIITLRTRP